MRRCLIGAAVHPVGTFLFSLIKLERRQRERLFAKADLWSLLFAGHSSRWKGSINHVHPARWFQSEHAGECCEDSCKRRIMHILFAFLALLLLVFCWFGLHYLGNKPIADPDGSARITGNCGDTMEIALQFKHGVVSDTYAWSNGCSFSRSCVEAATLLARGKSLGEVEKINMVMIMDEMGKLPETHLHCAQLAETTLQRAVKDCLIKQGARKKPKHNLGVG